ncbi:hypothetical protein BDZ89DRAFT_1040404 [Hymenopellis radicata]|nr:hypothetical protein BDZ89DRAFT_1040404 [Hymenopellis radicata]
MVDQDPSSGSADTEPEKGTGDRVDENRCSDIPPNDKRWRQIRQSEIPELSINRLLSGRFRERDERSGTIRVDSGVNSRQLHPASVPYTCTEDGCQWTSWRE